MLEELKKGKYNVIEDLVHRLQLTYDEIIDILDSKYIPTKKAVYTLNAGFYIYEVIDLNYTLKHFLTDNVKVSVTIDDVRLKSNLKINQTLFSLKSLFYTVLGFTQSRSYLLDDKERFYHLIAGSYKSPRPINITGFNKVHLKRDCIDGSIVNGVR